MPPIGCGAGSLGSEASLFASADQAHAPWLYWRGESYLPNSSCPEILVRYMPPEPSAVSSMKKVLLRILYQPGQLEVSPCLFSASLPVGLCLLLRAVIAFVQSQSCVRNWTNPDRTSQCQRRIWPRPLLTSTVLLGVILRLNRMQSFASLASLPASFWPVAYIYRWTTA
jgi:hypothetical protein